jgi:hypothetical protein
MPVGVAAVGEPSDLGEALRGEPGFVLAGQLTDEPAPEIVEAVGGRRPG